ncbi:MAG TPA: hypothetical protein VL285_20420, partial [Bryobacteraceae bacterium]|nr:hypothetical protein [Bryobacteraceae bacterium]
RPDGWLEVQWGGLEYTLHHSGRSLSLDEMRLVGAIGNVLSARFRRLYYTGSEVTSFDLFRGLPEDHYVSAYLHPAPFNGALIPAAADRISTAIELLRIASLTTYENRRVSTGVLLLGSNERPAPSGAVPYDSGLSAIKSFHRLSDGLRTVFAVNAGGLLVDLVDIEDFACAPGQLPAPSPAIYQAHARATLDAGHLCLALTPSGEIKIWAGGVQQFNFLGGRWRLTEAVERYRVWVRAIGDERLAGILFTAALNMAEARHGGIFVVLDEAGSARQFVSASDLLFDGESLRGKKDRIQYLLRGRRALEMSPAILETISRVDGAIVLDRESNLLAFGAILRHDLTAAAETEIVEGSRTTAAIESSRYGSVLKISEDGLVSFYQNRRRVWEI